MTIKRISRRPEGKVIPIPMTEPRAVPVQDWAGTGLDPLQEARPGHEVEAERRGLVKLRRAAAAADDADALTPPWWRRVTEPRPGDERAPRVEPIAPGPWAPRSGDSPDEGRGSREASREPAVVPVMADASWDPRVSRIPFVPGIALPALPAQDGTWSTDAVRGDDRPAGAVLFSGGGPSPGGGGGGGGGGGNKRTLTQILADYPNQAAGNTFGYIDNYSATPVVRSDRYIRAIAPLEKGVDDDPARVTHQDNLVVVLVEKRLLDDPATGLPLAPRCDRPGLCHTLARRAMLAKWAGVYDPGYDASKHDLSGPLKRLRADIDKTPCDLAWQNRDLRNVPTHHRAAVLSIDVFSGAVPDSGKHHQAHCDGATLLAIRRFLQEVRANYARLRGVILVGAFPEAMLVRRWWEVAGGKPCVQEMITDARNIAVSADPAHHSSRWPVGEKYKAQSERIKELVHDPYFERELLVEYLQRNHDHRSGKYAAAKSLFRVSSAIAACAPADELDTWGFAKLTWAFSESKPPRPTGHVPGLTWPAPGAVNAQTTFDPDFLFWVFRPALLRTIVAHGGWEELTINRPLDWLKDQAETAGKTLREQEKATQYKVWYPFWRARLRCADMGPGSFYWSISSYCNVPKHSEHYPFNDHRYGYGQTAESLLFMGNGLGVISRAHTGWAWPGVDPEQKQTGAPDEISDFERTLALGRTIGETWRAIFERAWNKPFPVAKSIHAERWRLESYKFGIQGDRTLRVNAPQWNGTP